MRTNKYHELITINPWPVQCVVCDTYNISPWYPCIIYDMIFINSRATQKALYYTEYIKQGPAESLRTSMNIQGKLMKMFSIGKGLIFDIWND